VSLVASDLVAISGGKMLELVEVVAPLVRNRTRIIKVRLVELLDVWGVTAKKV
jgi:hypothetical protein